MSKLEWVKELIRGEDALAENGVVDLTLGFDQTRYLVIETLEFLASLKTAFVEASTNFNDLKSSSLGKIKIYGIAKTHADFMLFRNGFKMVFSMKDPGTIAIRFNFFGPNYVPTITSNLTTSQNVMEENCLIAKKGPLQELTWTFQDHPVRIDNVVRYYLTLFVKESAK